MATELDIVIESDNLVPKDLAKVLAQTQKMMQQMNRTNLAMSRVIRDLIRANRAFSHDAPAGLRKAKMEAREIEKSAQRASGFWGRLRAAWRPNDFGQANLQFARSTDLGLRSATKLRTAGLALLTGGVVGAGVLAGGRAIMQHGDTGTLARNQLATTLMTSYQGVTSRAQANAMVPGLIQRMSEMAANTPGTDEEFMNAFNRISPYTGRKASENLGIVQGLLAAGHRSRGTEGRQFIMNDVVAALQTGTINTAEMFDLTSLMQTAYGNDDFKSMFKKADTNGRVDMLLKALEKIAPEIELLRQTYAAQMTSLSSQLGNLLYIGTQPFYKSVNRGLGSANDILAANRNKLGGVAAHMGGAFASVLGVGGAGLFGLGAAGAGFTALTAAASIITSIIGTIAAVMGGAGLGVGATGVILAFGGMLALFLNPVLMSAIAAVTAFFATFAYKVATTEGAVYAIGRSLEYLGVAGTSLITILGKTGVALLEVFAKAFGLEGGDSVLKKVEDAAFSAASGIRTLAAYIEMIPAAVDVAVEGLKSMGVYVADKRAAAKSGLLYRTVSGQVFVDAAGNALNSPLATSFGRGALSLAGPLAQDLYSAYRDTPSLSSQMRRAWGNSLNAPAGSAGGAEGVPSFLDFALSSGAGGSAYDKARWRLNQVYARAMNRANADIAAGLRAKEIDAKFFDLEGIKRKLDEAAKGAATQVTIERIEIRTEHLDDPQRVAVAFEEFMEQVNRHKKGAARRAVAGTPSAR